MCLWTADTVRVYFICARSEVETLTPTTTLLELYFVLESLLATKKKLLPKKKPSYCSAFRRTMPISER
uniref:Uncharacterized protein n=1 Tax=Megaselia scalaris TaxID=36166 RepID=T1GWY6_MEGSC